MFILYREGSKYLIAETTVTGKQKWRRLKKNIKAKWIYIKTPHGARSILRTSIIGQANTKKALEDRYPHYVI